MRDFVTLAEIDQAVHAVQAKLPVKPVVGLVLGFRIGRVSRPGKPGSIDTLFDDP